MTGGELVLVGLGLSGAVLFFIWQWAEWRHREDRKRAEKHRRGS